MEKQQDYGCASQQRILKVALALAGQEFSGITPGELAKATGISASNVTRDLFNLRSAGLAEEMPDAQGRWRLGPKLVQVALGYMRCRDTAEARLKEMGQRYTRQG